MADGLQEEHCLGRQIGCSVEDVRGLLLEGLRRVKELPEDAVLCDVYVMGQNVVLMAKVPGDEGYRFTLEVYGGKTPRETSLEVLLEVLSQNGYNRREAALYAYRRHWDLLDGRWISAQRRLVVEANGDERYLPTNVEEVERLIRDCPVTSTRVYPFRPAEA